MIKYKKENKLYSSLANFLIIGAVTKFVFSLSIIVLSILAILNYQHNAYDHIRIIAQSSNQDSFLSFLDRPDIAFNMTLETDDEKLIFENISTPYSFKVPKGKRISVEVTAESKFICAKLKSAGSSVAGSYSKSMKLERIGKQFKINCPE